MPPIDLPGLTETTGTAIGLIFSTGILLSWLTARYAPAYEQYRGLTAEQREGKGEGRRRDLLRQQVAQYRRRLVLLNRASELLCGVMVLAIGTIIAAGVAKVVPGVVALNVGGAAALLLSLTASAVAVGVLFVENRIDRHAILAEAGDIPEVNG